MPVPKAADRLLIRAARRAPGWTAALVLAIAAGAAVSLLVPAALAAAVDAALRERHLATAVTRLAALLAAGAAADVVAGLAGASYEATTTAWLRHRLLGQGLALGIPGQRRFPPGDLISRLGADAPAAGQVLPDLLQAGAAVAASAGAVAALALIDWRLAAVFLLGLPPALALVRAFMAHASELFVRYQRLQAAIAARLVDALAGMRTIRASGTADREVERVLGPLEELSGTGRALWHTQRRVAWGVALLLPLEETLVLAGAGLGVASGRLSPGELLAAAGYVRLALRLFEQIDVLVEAARARAGAARAAEVLDERPARRPTGALPLSAGQGAVSLRGVTVRAGGTRVLDRLDLEVPAGASVALVGRSGAGKTTLAWLVGRLGDPEEGEVLLDGVPVAALAPRELRRAVVYAFERPVLLGGTIAGAIAYGRPGATGAEVERAARAAQADGFVRRLPDGYETPVRAAPLSGGEAQRLGLARAVAQDGRVLVLDDATSSLDTATEMRVSEALAALLGGRTRLVVAHRTATAARADLVAWLDGGRVRALAPHAALWQDPDYRAVFAAGGAGRVRVGTPPPPGDPGQ